MKMNLLELQESISTLTTNNIRGEVDILSFIKGEVNDRTSISLIINKALPNSKTKEINLIKFIASNNLISLKMVSKLFSLIDN